MSEHEGKKYTPPKDHPWRRTPTGEQVRWAKEQSEIGRLNNFRIGQLKKK